MTYGLFDLTDSLWLGGDSGPHAIADEKVAERMRELVCERLNWQVDRVQVRPSEQANIKQDTLVYEKTIEEAIDAITMRWLSKATGISVEKLRRFQSGEQMQTCAEDKLLRIAFGLETGDE